MHYGRRVPTYALLVSGAVAFIVGLTALAISALVDSRPWMAFGLLGIAAASWLDRWRVGRIVSDRYVRVLSFWQADVDALNTNGVRPDPARIDP